MDSREGEECDPVAEGILGRGRTSADGKRRSDHFRRLDVVVVVG